MSDEAKKSPARKADAVLYPATLKGQRGLRGREAIDAVLRPILGDGLIHHRSVGGNQWMASMDPADTFLYPTGHEMEKTERYDFEPGPDGIRIGRLKPDESDRLETVSSRPHV